MIYRIHLFLFVFLNSVSFSQSDEKFEFNGGYILSNLSAKSNGENMKTNVKSGFMFGMRVTEVYLNSKDESKYPFSLEFGCAFTATGSYINATGASTDSLNTSHSYNVSRNTRIYNFEFPLILKQHFGHKKLRYYADYGIYAGLNFGGFNKSTYTYTETLISEPSNTYSFDEREEFSGDKGTGRYKHTFVLGARLGAGIIYNNFRFGITYSHGFLNQVSDDQKILNDTYFLYNSNYKNIFLTVSLGYSVNRFVGK